jgi:plastocyanin
MRRTALIAAAVLAFGAGAAPARAATVEVSVANFAFTPASVSIAPGDTVTWRFSGLDTDHSTTSDAGQAESWESDPGDPTPNHTIGDTFSHTFNATGPFGYFCRVHPYMRGRVVVGAPGDPAADTAPPRISTLRSNLRRRRVTFKLSEPATVAGRLRGATRRNYSLNGKAGTNVLRLPRRMNSGRHTLTLRATDAAGNRSATPKVVLTVRG